jgi:hypothetical protein
MAIYKVVVVHTPNGIIIFPSPTAWRKNITHHESIDERDDDIIVHVQTDRRC